ncbi:MAG: hypothetical protein IPP94_11715 [Ignavibacteria bacterium]|nr:hypothetical protein [Ignavibacteria bacterium]
MEMTSRHSWLLALARDAGDRYFDAQTRWCLIQRDTLWYAAALLFDAEDDRRALGRALIAEATSGDGTHTPATMLALLHGCADRLDDGAKDNIIRNIRLELPRAALVELHDGNVNHPLGAWATLVLGGELTGEGWAVELGRSRLARFRATIGDRRHAGHRQSAMSEYCSPTYTALDLCFLALIAEYAGNAEARLLARFLEERLWVDTAMSFHAPSAQFAGPHSRSYQDDSSGGWSGLHAVFHAALDHAMPLDPETALRFEHPSALLQNGLVAITPFHVPAQARRIALEKPFPYTVRRTTYGEAYHENHAAAGFSDEVYPGGWSELTTHMTEDYALGTASLPYVNAGHADAFMLRLRRSADPCCTGEVRSLFCRGVYNESAVGQRNRCHVTGGDIDASFLYEEGRTATHQHGGTAIVLYAPKRAGHAGVRSFRVDLMFSPALPFDRLRIGGTDVPRLPHESAENAPLFFQDGTVFCAIHPLRGPGFALRAMHPSPSTDTSCTRCTRILVSSAISPPRRSMPGPAVSRSNFRPSRSMRLLMPSSSARRRAASTKPRAPTVSAMSPSRR